MLEGGAFGGSGQSPALLPCAVPRPMTTPLAPGATLLAGHALPHAAELVRLVHAVAGDAPFRHMLTRRGPIAAAMTNCGAGGWVSDRRGYRYAASDPEHGRPWPPMPALFATLAHQAAAEAGFPGFRPDACLVNRYEPGAGMALHQDSDERDLASPIVSVSLGLPAVFLFGGLLRTERPRRVMLAHGDVVVWGGPSRLAFHGIAPLRDGEHDLLGRQRINLTFRHAL